MKELIHKLESAAEGSRELSDEWLLAMGWLIAEESHAFPRFWSPPGSDLCLTDEERPDPSRNLQDTVDAVPEGWVIEMSLETPPTFATAILSPIINGGQGSEGVKYANAATPALALSAAIARAMMEEE